MAATAGLTAETMLAEWTWKTPAMKQMTLDVCRLAIRTGLSGFTALDLAHRGADDQGGTGIAGSVFKQLANAGIIAAVGTFIDGEFFQRRVRNAGGNPIGVWRVANTGLAEALLRVHGSPSIAAQQAEMLLHSERT